MKHPGELCANLFYGLMAAITFAWSAADPDHKCKPEQVESYSCAETLDRIGSGSLAGAFWPLYWLWTGAEYIRSLDDA